MDGGQQGISLKTKPRSTPDIDKVLSGLLLDSADDFLL